MDPQPTEATGAPDSSDVDETAAHIRGSSALMLGKLIGIVLSLGIQVLLVRGLTRTEFGAFGYALSIASMAMVFVSLGTTKAIPRFLGLYDESGDDRSLVGTLAFETLLIASLGAAISIGLLAFRGLLGEQFIDNDLAFTLTAILILTAPQEAFDKVLEAFAATIGETRVIFLRKYIFDPVFRLIAIGLLIVLDASAPFLAVAYVVAGLIGTSLYLSLVVKQLRSRGLLHRFRTREFDMPVRDIVRFSVPMLSHDLVFVTVNAVAVVLIGSAAGVDEVATFRAVFPIARMNQVIGWTFAVLYMPLAGRFFARGDRVAMRDAYWRSAAWLAVLTLPVFLLTAVFASPLVDTMFGNEYADSAPVLAILAAGYYLNMSLGFNTLTLQTFGHLRFTIVVDILAVAAFFVVALLSIDAHGAIGAAAAATTSLVVLNVGGQIGVWRMGLGAFERTVLPVYVATISATAFCVLLAWAFDPPLILAVIIVGLVSCAVVFVSRRQLDVVGTFPQIQRIPALDRILR